jgi:hypothetical protein
MKNRASEILGLGCLGMDMQGIAIAGHPEVERLIGERFHNFHKIRLFSRWFW